MFIKLLSTTYKPLTSNYTPIPSRHRKDFFFPKKDLFYRVSCCLSSVWKSVKTLCPCPGTASDRNSRPVQPAEILILIQSSSRAERGLLLCCVAWLPNQLCRPERATTPQQSRALQHTQYYCDLRNFQIFSSQSSLLSFRLPENQKTKSICPRSLTGNISLSSLLMMPWPTR